MPRILVFFLQISAIVVTQPNFAPVHGLTDFAVLLLAQGYGEPGSRKNSLRKKASRGWDIIMDAEGNGEALIYGSPRASSTVPDA